MLRPTLTGLGERSHLHSPAINASTHVRDILNVVAFEQLDEVVLVGHSYGGQVITAIADAIPEKLAALVYLDAFVGENGKSTFDMDISLEAADRAAGRKLSCPVLVLWPQATAVAGRPTPIETWRRRPDDVDGRGTRGDHLQPEDASDEVLAAVLPFLARWLHGHDWLERCGP